MQQPPAFPRCAWHWGALALACTALVLQAATPATPAITGITEPFMDVTLSASVPGTVASRFFKEGDFVRQGQVIVELDKRLEELTVTRRKLVADTSKSELENSRILFNSTKSVSKEEIEKKDMEYKVSVVDHETAIEQLRKRQIVSPIDGTITEIFLKVGEDCKAQEPVVRLVDTRRAYFVCNVEGRLGYEFKTNQVVHLDIDAGNSAVSVEARVTYVSPVIDPASGLMKIKVLFENPEGRIRPGAAGRLTPSGGSNAR